MRGLPSSLLFATGFSRLGVAAAGPAAELGFRGTGACNQIQMETLPGHGIPGLPTASRPDVLVYSTDALEEELEVTGPIQASIYASSSARDTDWTVKLLDIYPDGKAVDLWDGILRARYRDPAAIRAGVPSPGQFENPKLLKPGKTCKFFVEVGVDTEVVIANQTVYHDAEHPSHILLPVIPEY